MLGQIQIKIKQMWLRRTLIRRQPVQRSQTVLVIGQFLAEISAWIGYPGTKIFTVEACASRVGLCKAHSRGRLLVISSG